MAAELCDLQIHINGEQSFFLNQKIISKFSAKLKNTIINQEQSKKTQIRIEEFPGGPNGFELISRFCYNGGQITVTLQNISLLHCCAVFLDMSEKISPCNLLHQTEIFLDGIFYWSWTDILQCLKSCESFFSFADSIGFVQKLIGSLLVKISQNSDVKSLVSPSPSPASSSSPGTPKLAPRKTCWWFDELTILPPKIIERLMKSLGEVYGNEGSLVITRFLLHYLRTVSQFKGGTKVNRRSQEYVGIADSAVKGVIMMGKSSFSCRGLFWVLRIVSGFGVSKNCRVGLEKMIGGMLDQATLDHLLVSGHGKGPYFDINLVLRLTRVFIHGDEDEDKVCLVERMKKVGKLIDMYLGEIAPDHNLKLSKFIAVAQSLPDLARDCFDGVYRAIDIYLQSHQKLTVEERSRICRCIKYEKLSLEACKDLAKNPTIPPRIAVQALSSQYSNIYIPSPFDEDEDEDEEEEEENDEFMRMNLKRMQWRVVELERACMDVKAKMSSNHPTFTSFPRRLC